MTIDCNDPRNKDDPLCNVKPATPEQQANEKRLTGGGLGVFVGKDPLDESINENAKDLCRIQDGTYDKKTDSCNTQGIEIKDFSKLVGRQLYKDVLIRQIDQNQIPNYLFVGPFGTGKTSFAKAIALEYAVRKGLDPAQFLSTNTISVSGHNGIDFIRDRIETFIKTQGLTRRADQKAYKMIFIDEADELSMAAQSQLKTVYNQITERKLPVSIILMSNYPGKVLPDITQSGRFQLLDFDKIPDVEMRTIATATAPNAKITDNLINYSNGNIRSLEENITRTNSGLPLRDFRLQDVEQAEKTIQREETRIQLLRREAQLKIRAEAVNTASQYTRQELLRDIIHIQETPTEESPAQEELLISALRYKGMTDPQINSAIKDLKRQEEQAHTAERQAGRSFQMPGVESFGIDVRALTPEGLRAMRVESTNIRFNGAQQQYYELARQLYAQAAEAKEKNDIDSKEAFENQVIVLTLRFESRYSNVDFGPAQKQAQKDAYGF